MIDTNQVSAIQHRIAAQGIKQTGQLEELVDHYLTSLECKIENGEVPHQALLATLAEIDIGGLYFFADANDPPSNIEPPITEQTSFPEAWPVEATSKEVSSGFGPRQQSSEATTLSFNIITHMVLAICISKTLPFNRVISSRLASRLEL